MKQFQHIATLVLASLFALSLSSCGEQDEVMNRTENDEKGIAIESITATLQGMQGEVQGAETRAGKDGTKFAVNEKNDPTKKGIVERGKAGWEMDFTLYNGTAKYDDGSFTGATYNEDKSTQPSTWAWNWQVQKYFPNYKIPNAEAVLYPTPGTNNPEITKDQSKEDGSTLLAQDILVRGKGQIKVAHTIELQFNHKHSMLDFVIKDVNREDIKEVKVSMDGGNTPESFDYVPYQVTTETTGVGDIEYMLIVSEESKFNPIVQIITQKGTNNTQSITYKQTIGILKTENSTETLAANTCYCFTLQGADLKISPITILNWATGESLPGEYIAVTAYPTFKAEDYAGETFYFYYDSKLKENGKPKLQAITFNENAECTIKPDGRILTHIYTPDQVEDITDSKEGNKTPKAGEEAKGGLTSPVILGTMVVDVKTAIQSVANN